VHEMKSEDGGMTSGLDEQALATLRGRLIELRASLRSEAAREAQDVATAPEDRGEDLTPSQHPADVASDLDAREILLTRRISVSAELAAVEDALARIERGTYGRCADCGGAIPLERLTALPQAERDIACERAEHAQRFSNRPVHSVSRIR
jgi:DnaK suppressor protein